MQYNHWALVQHVSQECVKYGIKFRMVRYGGTACSGYFDYDARVLSCALRHSMWPTVLAHEYCHMMQWAEDLPEPWDSPAMAQHDEVIFSKAKRPVKLFERAAIAYRELELDCEKRALEVVKEYKLMDPAKYIAAANAYIFFYNFYRRYKKWSTRAASRVPEILALMPDFFLDDYSVSPPGYNALVWEHCIRP